MSTGRWPVSFRTNRFAIDLKHAPGGPSVNRWVDVAEGPLVGGKLPVRLHIPLTGEEDQLLFGELHIHERQRDAVKSQVPRGIAGILPIL